MEAAPLLHRLVTTGSALLASSDAGVPHRNSSCCSSSRIVRPQSLLRSRLVLAAAKNSSQGRMGCQILIQEHFLSSSRNNVSQLIDRGIPRTRSTGSSSPNDITEEQKSLEESKTPFGYSRKDVLLIGIGVTLLGVGLKSGLEFVGVDPLQAGNVVQLTLVLGLTVAWIGTYIFRVSNKDMTYAKQLRDYEQKVMEKRLETLTEAEIQVLLEQVEEEKRRLASRKKAE